jgi:hypothetical protein
MLTGSGSLATLVNSPAEGIDMTVRKKSSPHKASAKKSGKKGSKKATGKNPPPRRLLPGRGVDRNREPRQKLPDNPPLKHGKPPTEHDEGDAGAQG